MQKGKPAAPKARKSYTTPKLITHGDVRKLTGGHGKGHGDPGPGGPGSGLFSPGDRRRGRGD